VADADVQTQEDATYAGNVGPLAPADSGEEVQAAAQESASSAAAPADPLAIGSSDASVAQARDQFAQLNEQMEANLAAVEKRRDE
jgi:hypothetical protein